MKIPINKLARIPRAFTLVEVMISIVIIGTTLVSLLIVRNRAIEDIAVINEARILRVLAEKKIAEIEIQVEKNESGDFSNEGYPEFQWEMVQETLEIKESSGVTEPGEEPPETETGEEEVTYSLNRITLTIQYGLESRYELVLYHPLSEEEQKEPK
ncbi:MAG: type II secretion system protein [Planctomycetota bacterium]